MIHQSPSPFDDETEEGTATHHSSKKTAQQEWRDEHNAIMRQIDTMEKESLNDLEQREKSLRLQLSESIEEMRERLLEQTQDFSVRDTVNQNFISTRQQIKNDLRQLRDKEEDKIRARKKAIEDLIAALNQMLAPLFIENTAEALWKEIKEGTTQVVPEIDQMFLALDLVVSSKSLYKDGPLSKEIKKCMDRFQSDMEDQLDDLNGNIHFQIRISEENVE